MRHPFSDEAARERIRGRLDETLFVEAGAGTGKTTALVERIVELVATGTATLAQIAAITFTEAAAAELRDRVRQDLERGAGEDPCPERRAACALASADVDQAAILTLHSFARRLLVEHPLEAGLPPGFEVADEVTSQLVFEQRWAELLDELLAEEELAGSLLDGLALGMRVEHLREVARAFDRDYDRLENPGAIPSVDARPEPLSSLVAAVGTAGECLGWCTDPNDKLYTHLAGLSRLCARLDEARGDRERLRLLSGARLRFAHGQNRNWGGRVTEVRERLKELQGRCDALLTARRNQALAPLLARLRQHTLDAAAHRATEGRLEFHDLLVRARALLRDHPEVREHLASRYRFLLVDEFQDTDPLQVEIAVRLGGEGCGRLFFVGDARQSIYRFRRADLATYQRTRERFREGAITLSRNHRSVPSILDWVNGTFAALFGTGEGGPGGAAGGRGSDPGEGQAPHRPLDGYRPGLGDGPAVRLLGGPVDGRAAEVRDRESAAIAAAIRDLHGQWPVTDPQTGVQRPARYDDIAILMPARTALPQLERALEDAGIPFRVEARSLIYATQEVRELLAILRAIDDPTDQVAIVAALRAPALGCTDRDLVTWRAAGGRWSYLAPPPVEDHSVAVGLARLAALHQRRRSDTPSGIVEAVIRDCRLLELACAHRRPREAWQRLRYVLDQARAFTERTASLRDLCAWMQHQADEDTRVTEQVLPDDDDEAVRVLTVHGAKGLEFPVAILCGLASPRRAVPGPVVVWDDDGRAQVRLRKGFETPGFEAAYARERHLEALEEVRLLYVAATRARDHLVVGVHHRPTERGDGSLAERVWHLAQATPWRWRPLQPDVQFLADVQERADMQRTAHLPVDENREAWLAEREALVAVHASAPVAAATTIAGEMTGAGGDLGVADDDPDADPDRPPWRRGRARTAVGRAVHAVLQTVDLATGGGVDAMARAQAAAEGVPGRAVQIAKLARSALDSGAVRAALGSGRYWRELAVAGEVEGLTVEGYVDLLYKRADGLVLVGYRTDPAPDGQLDALAARYAWQTAASALALEAALGRPVVACRLVFVGDGQAGERAVTDLAAAKAAVRAHLRARTPVTSG